MINVLMNSNKRKLDQQIGNIYDPETTAVVQELSTITGISWCHHLEETFFQFIQLCHHPGGGLSKFKRITLKQVAEYESFESFELRKSVGECGDHLYGICKELAPRTSHVENFSVSKLYVFFGKMLDPKRGKDRGRYSH